MSISRIKQIKRILAHGDVRDPRAALVAIEQVVAQPKQKKVDKQAPAFELIAKRLSETLDGDTIKGDESLTEPEMLGPIDTMRKHREIVFGPVAKKMSIEEIFAAVEAGLIKSAGVKEGGAK